MTGEADATYWKTMHAALLRSHTELAKATEGLVALAYSVGVPTDPEHPARIAVARAEAALANCKPEGGK